MIEALIFWLVICLLVLVVASVWLVQYVVLPVALVRAFFRSEWAPQGLKDVVGWALGVLALLLTGGLGWRWHLHQRQAQAQHLAWQQEVHEARMPRVRLTVRQPGLLPYPLGRGRIEAARPDPLQLLVVSGDLPGGQRLRATFTATRGVGSAVLEPTRVTVQTDQGAASQATGQRFYAPDAQTVRGSFRCVLPSGKQLVVSFPSTSLASP